MTRAFGAALREDRSEWAGLITTSVVDGAFGASLHECSVGAGVCEDRDRREDRLIERMGPDREGGDARRFGVTFGLVCLAAALGAFRLGDKNLWLDEAASASFALGDPAAHWADNNMVLYYALLGGWVKLFGASEEALRSLSVLCFALGAGLFHRLALWVLAERAASMAGLLFVANAYLVQFAQEARGYALATTLLIAAALCMCRLLASAAPCRVAPATSPSWLGGESRAVERPSEATEPGELRPASHGWNEARPKTGVDARSREAARRAAVWGWAAAYALTLAAALYTHLFCAWVALAFAAVSVRAWCRQRTARLPLMAAYGFAAASVVPLLVRGLDGGSAQVSWIRPPTLSSVEGMFVRWSGGSAALAVLESALFGGFALSGLRASRQCLTRSRRDHDADDENAATHAHSGRWLVIGWFLLPVLGSLGFSSWVAPIAHPKYLLVVVPAWLLGTAAGLERVRVRPLRAGLFAVALGLSLLRLHFWYADYQKERWREVVRAIAAERREGDVIVLDLFGSEAFDYYVWRLGVAPDMPELIVPTRGWGFPTPAVTGPDLSGAAIARLQAAPRVWYVQNRERRLDAAEHEFGAKRLVWTRRYEPQDDDERSLYADSAGRIITLRLFATR